MNKAFVKESDQDEDDESAPGVPSLPPGTRNYMTRNGFEMLKAELDELVRDERPSWSRQCAGLRPMETARRTVITSTARNVCARLTAAYAS